MGTMAGRGGLSQGRELSPTYAFDEAFYCLIRLHKAPIIRGTIGRSMRVLLVLLRNRSYVKTEEFSGHSRALN